MKKGELVFYEFLVKCNITLPFNSLYNVKSIRFWNNITVSFGVSIDKLYSTKYSTSAELPGYILVSCLTIKYFIIRTRLIVYCCL